MVWSCPQFAVRIERENIKDGLHKICGNVGGRWVHGASNVTMLQPCGTAEQQELKDRSCTRKHAHNPGGRVQHVKGVKSLYIFRSQDSTGGVVCRHMCIH